MRITDRCRKNQESFAEAMLLLPRIEHVSMFIRVVLIVDGVMVRDQ